MFTKNRKRTVSRTEASRSKRVSASFCEHRARRTKYDSAGNQRIPLPPFAHCCYIIVPCPPLPVESEQLCATRTQIIRFCSHRCEVSLSSYFASQLVAATMFLVPFPSSVWLTLSYWQIGTHPRQAIDSVYMCHLQFPYLTAGQTCLGNCIIYRKSEQFEPRWMGVFRQMSERT